MLSVFHGFRRRSKLSEAELEDQRALEQVMTENDIVIEYCTVLYCSLHFKTIIAATQRVSFRFPHCNTPHHTTPHHTSPLSGWRSIAPGSEGEI